MEHSEIVLKIIQDHALITRFLTEVASSLSSGRPLPNFIPMCNDGLVTDDLTVIAEHLNKCERS